ncbi:phospholipase D-like domain-containing protein [uncultured Clostridium sp.]|uniref:phospholipase D-like domain-containing protein n=1 Tax=uncultured Clostridium sp. TaxID=59620 RepID=UPI0025ED1D48|nr:phospholipase D-like domain-containing protein [uncultured Clostridium sp.]
MNLYVIVTSVLLIIDLGCAVSLIFVEKRDSTTTWAWLLVLAIFPFLGFILYLCLGQNISKEKIFRKKARIDKNKLKHIIEKFKKASQSSKEHNPYIDLIKMNYNTSGSIYTDNNVVKTYINGEDKFKDLFEDIKNASSFINIQYYIFRCDDLGVELLNLLGKKVSEGIEVRLLVDGMGSNSITKKEYIYIKNLGIKFSFFFPSLIRFINLRINYRNHRKIVVIDGKIGYIGGFNVGNEYVNKGKQFDFWRDTHLRIKGDAVLELQTRFALDWEYAADESIDEKQFIIAKLTPSADDTYVLSDLFNNEIKNNNNDDFADNKSKAFDNVGIQIISSGPDNLEEYIRNSYLKIINNARKNIYIQTPYLVPDEPIIMALKLAASSGVDVKIMVPDKADHFFMAYALSSSIDTLIKSGIKFYKYKKGFIHSKTISADSMVCSIGTANLDIRSFKLNFEINAVIYNNNLVRYNEDIFINDLNDCRLVTIEEHENRNLKTKILESLLRLIFPLL